MAPLLMDVACYLAIKIDSGTSKTIEHYNYIGSTESASMAKFVASLASQPLLRKEGLARETSS